jgi:hypothetical protein
LGTVRGLLEYTGRGPNGLEGELLGEIKLQLKQEKTGRSLVYTRAPLAPR